MSVCSGLEDLLGCHVVEAFTRLLLSERVQVTAGAVLHDEARELGGLEMGIESGQEWMIQGS